MACRARSPALRAKLYAQLPIDIEYHGVMHAAKTPFWPRQPHRQRVGWRYSYNLIPRSSATSPWSSASAPSVAPSRSRTASWFLPRRAGRTGKQRSEAHLAADAYPIAQLPPGKESFMTFADSASGRLLREVYDARVQMAASGELRALYQAGTARCPAPCRPFRRSDAPSFPPRSLSGACAAGMKRLGFAFISPLTHRKGGYIDDSVLYPSQAAPGLTATETYRSTPAPLNDSRPCVRASFRREVIGCRGPLPGFHFSVGRPSPFRECPLGFGLPPDLPFQSHGLDYGQLHRLCPRASH